MPLDLCYNDLFLYGNNVTYVRDLACVLFHNVLTSAVVLTYCVYRRCAVWGGAGGGGGASGSRCLFRAIFTTLDFVAMFLNRPEDVQTSCFCSFRGGDAYAT